MGAAVRTYTDTGVVGSLTYTVRAFDAAGNLSDASNTATATVADTVKPTTPSGLTATGSAGQVALSWQPSTDNLGVTGYRIYRNGSQVGSVLGNLTAFTHTGLAAGTYSYTVRAVDAAGNLSDASAVATATVPDSVKPTAPGNLKATAGTGQVVVGLEGLNRQRRGHRLPHLSQRHPGRERKRDDPHVHRHGPRARHLQLHGARDRRRRQPVGPKQDGERDRNALIVITNEYKEGAGGQPRAEAGEETVDKQHQEAWEALRAIAMNHEVTIEQGESLLNAVEEITRQSLVSCYGPRCFTISN